MQKVIKLMIGAFLIPALSLAGRFANPVKNSVSWINPQEMERRQLIENRPVLVKIYTDWCVYCRKMDSTTWVNDSLKTYVDSHFYAVKLDAEHEQNYLWAGESFEFRPKFKVNMLAVKLLQGNMVYPSTVIIPISGEPLILPGARSANELESILKFYGEGMDKKMQVGQFVQNFSSRWK